MTVLEDPYDFIFHRLPKKHRVLKAKENCKHCGAKRIRSEPDSFCCMNGKTELVDNNIPPELYDLFTADTDIAKLFRLKIRAYNTNFSFASLGVKLDKSLASNSEGVYTFRVQGGIYHSLDQLIPRDGQPKYLQMYFYDTETQVEISRRLEWDYLDREIVESVTRILAPNPYVQTFRSLAQLGPLDKYKVSLNASVDHDQRVYNRPTTAEV